ncbi:MAG: transglycosylase SLT domain-containing protein [Chitinispirillaceae bacterium]|nr:transglycosylase SLT domain-containing protein [Chitinispirillaceae bacterium]
MSNGFWNKAALGIGLLLMATACAEDRSSLFSLTTDGTGGLRSGNCREALDTLRKKRKGVDAGVRLFNLGIAYACVGDTSRALSRFRRAALEDSVVAPFAWEAVGDIAVRWKNLTDSAFSCYLRALATPLPYRYRKNLFEKTYGIIGEDTARITDTALCREYNEWLVLRRPRAKDPLFVQVDSLVDIGDWTKLDTVITTTLTALDSRAQSHFIKAIYYGSPPDTCFRAATYFLLARVAMERRLLDIAESFLASAQKTGDFQTAISSRRLQWLRGIMYYYEKKYHLAVPMLRAYIRTYGYEPGLALVIARAYWGLDSIAKSAWWYDRFIARYPRSRSIPELLWRRAWMEEERGRLKAAIRFFQKLHTTYPRHKRAEEARFRHGFCYYQAGIHDSAIHVFSLFEKNGPSSSLLPAAAYWKAKSLLGKGRVEEAGELLAEIGRSEPYNYYAHRARYLLRLIGDTLNASVDLDTLYSEPYALAWLDSVAIREKPVQPEDSVNLRRGLILGAIGAIKEASMFLLPFELTYHGNLGMQFRIAHFYRNVNGISQAAKTGRRFAWRIPPENRSRIPLAVYSLMYPVYYREMVVKQAQQWNVDPCLIWAVIRQESVFNAQVVSPAGAIGLMQIMPSTGKEISRELHHPFTRDSLNNPGCNILFGTYYLRKLLDQFNENEALAVASYNGGPLNAKEWYLRTQSEDLDLFVENIGFSETRNYVKKVLANYWTYSKLTRIASFYGKTNGSVEGR